MAESEKLTEAEEILDESKKMQDDDGAKKIRDVIFVGLKPIMTYVTATRSEEHTSELQSH